MPALLTPVKSKLFIVAHRRHRGLLDGEYASVFHGRSLDYDDLREYVPGDEVRDIDWKATARHGSPLVKRYVASRKQTVMFVVDTGRGMAAADAAAASPRRRSPSRRPALVGYLALRHGDLVGLVARHGRVDHRARLRRAGGAPRAAAARRRRRTRSWTATRATSRRSCAGSSRHYRHRLVLLVVADDKELDPDARRACCAGSTCSTRSSGSRSRTPTPRPRRRPDGLDVADDLRPADARVRLDPRLHDGVRRRRSADRRAAHDSSLLDRRGIIHARSGRPTRSSPADLRHAREAAPARR